MDIRYDDGKESSWPIRTTSICCKLEGPVVKNMTWVMSPNCNHPALLTSYSPTDTMSFGRGYISKRELSTSFVSLPPQYNDGLPYLSHCVQTVYEGESLPTGLYQCIMETDTGMYYEKSFGLQQHVGISLYLSKDGMLVTCEFGAAGSGRLDVERVNDGYVIFSTGLSYTALLSLGGSARIETNGNRMSMTILVTDGYMFNSTFRCRIKNRCMIASSVGLSLLGRDVDTTQKPTTSSEVVPEPTKTIHGSPQNLPTVVLPGRVITPIPYESTKNESLSDEQILKGGKNNIQKWTLVACMLVGAILVTVTVCAWFD